MEKSNINNDLKSGLLSWAIKGVTYKAYVAAVLMFAAGSWKWIAGWVYVIIFLLFDLATALVVFPRSPELLIERSIAHSDAKTWDKIIMPLAAGILPLISWIVAGLNLRLGWNPPLSREIQLLAVCITILGHGIIVWAMSANAFFSPLVRIQKERGHTVAEDGPYRIIRHPGYLGAIFFSISVPMMLGSWWAVIPGLASVILYIVRTSLEDQTLQDELSGYREFSERVKFRLIPGLW